MSCNNRVKLRKYEETVKRDHDSSSISRDKSSEIKREPTYINDIKDEPVYYGNNSTRGRINNHKRGSSNSHTEWKYNNIKVQILINMARKPTP